MAAYDNLRLEKGMYQVAGKSFTQVLEELDPSQQYRGTPLEGLDAYQRQLKRFDIKVSGRHSDCVEKFFATTTSAALFPEYVKRAVNMGMENSAVLDNIVASKTVIDSLDYRTITADNTAADKTLNVTVEGTAMTETTIKTKENLVTMKKRGRLLIASYEALRFQRLDLFTVTLKQIGNYLLRTQLEDAVTTLIEGDGNENPADEVAVAATGTLTYADLLKLWGEFEDYNMDALLADTAGMLKLVQLEEVQNPLTGLNFAGTGQLTTPMGARLYRTGAVPTGNMVALDSTCALEMVTAGDVMLEYDKLIDRQLERAAISCTYGFAKIFEDASKVLTL